MSVEGELRTGALDDESADRRLEELVSQLGALRAEDVARTGRLVTFRAGMFRMVSSWNALLPISHGRVELDVARGVLRYDLSCRQMLIVTSAMAVLMGGWALRSGGVFFGVAGGAAAWLWLFGMNYLTARFRMRRLLRRTFVVVPAPATPPTRF